MATLTVEDLYRLYAGKAPDPEGLAFWKQGFGSEITPDEVESFKQSVAAVRTAQPTSSSYVNNLPAVTYQTGAGDAPETVNRTQEEISYINGKWNELAAQAMGQPLYIYTGNMVNTGDGDVNETILNPAVTAKVKELKDAGFDIVGGSDNLNSTFQTYSLVNPQGQSVSDWSESGSMKNVLKGVAPIALAALTAGGAGGLLGSTIAPTASTALQGAIGGGLLGAGGAAITGNDILKGALWGGVGGYASGGGFNDSTALQAAQDADIAGGMIPEFGTTSAYDSFMSGAMTPAAQSAIEAQINQAAGMDNIDVGGGWSPATGGVNLPTGLQTTDQLSQSLQDWMSKVGSQPVNEVPEMVITADRPNIVGPQTAEQLGQGFQDYMAQSGYFPVSEIPEMVITADRPVSVGPQTPEQLGQGFADYMANAGYFPVSDVPEMVVTADRPTMTTPKDVWDVPSSIPDTVITTPDQISTMDQITNPEFSNPLPAVAAAATGTGLTTSQIANLIKAGVSIAGLAGAGGMLTSPSSSTPFTAPTQTPPTYTSDYYQQLQKYYDTYMPAVPRDVTTPLQQWYSSKYGA